MANISKEQIEQIARSIEEAHGIFAAIKGEQAV